MNFETFFKSLLNEKINFGEALEGIFAIGIAVFIADGHINLDKVDKIRQKVVIDGRKPYNLIIDSNVQDNEWVKERISNISGDKIQVGISINLRPNNVKGAYGPDTKNSTLDKLTNILANKIENTSAIKKISDFIIKILSNRKTDDVIFYVVADGIGSGTKGENIKGDVKLQVEARTNTPIPEQIEQPISFSLKMENPRVSSKSVFNTIFLLGKSFNLPFSQKLNIDNIPEKRNKLDELFYDYKHLISDDSNILYYIYQYQRNQDKAYTSDISENERNQIALRDSEIFLSYATKEIEQQLKKLSNTDELNIKAFNFIENEIFGSDLADVIDISTKDIKEITKSNFDTIKTKYTVEFSTIGKDMLFYIKNKDNEDRHLLFKLKPELRITPSQKTQRIEVIIGDILYSS